MMKLLCAGQGLAGRFGAKTMRKHCQEVTTASDARLMTS